MSTRPRWWTPALLLLSLALAAGTAAASSLYHGVTASPTGVALVDVSQDGMLDVVGVTSSGDDGVQFTCTNMDGMCVAMDGECSPLTDVGSRMTFTYQWSLATRPALSPSTSITTVVTSTGLDLTCDLGYFMPSSSSLYVVGRLHGTVVFTGLVPTPTTMVARVAMDASGHCPNPEMACFVDRSSHSMCASASFRKDITVTLFGNHVCDELVFSCPLSETDQDCGGVSSSLRVLAVPASTLQAYRCYDLSCRVMDHFVSGLGTAVLSVSQGDCSSGQCSSIPNFIRLRKLSVSAIDQLGNSGMEVRTSSPRCADGSCAAPGGGGGGGGGGGFGGGGGGGAVSLLYAAPSLHIDPSVDQGASMRISVVGMSFSSGAPMPASASVVLTVTGSNIVLTPDHSQLGMDTEYCVVLSHGVEVTRLALPTGGSCTVSPPPGASLACTVAKSGVSAGYDLAVGKKVAPNGPEGRQAAPTSVSSSSNGWLDSSCPLSYSFSSDRVFVIGGLHATGNQIVMYGGCSAGTPTCSSTQLFSVYRFEVTASCPSSSSSSSFCSLSVQAIDNSGGDQVSADLRGGSCLSSAHSSLPVSLVLHRVDTTPARAASVTFHVKDLYLNSVSEGDYFSRVGDTQMFVTDNGGGSFTADVSVFGPVCGSTGGGLLFELSMSRAPGVTSGNGLVVIDNVELRDCDNEPLPCDAGASAFVTISDAAPSPVVLSATQQRTGNPPGGVTGITLDWTAVGDDGTTSLYRKPFGNYPLYDNPPNAGSPPSVPASSAAAVADGWQLLSAFEHGDIDRPSSRDYYYYVCYTVNSCGVESAPSNMASSLDYHIGDVSNGVTPCTGDDRVDLADITYLGGHYGVTVGPGSALTCLDFGPTTNHRISGRPLTDGKLNFEELVLMAINFSVVSGPESRQAPMAASTNATRLAVPAIPAVGGTFEVGIEGEAAGNVQAMSVNLDYDHAVLEQVSVARGRLLDEQARGALVLSSGPGDVDLALLGTGSGLSGTGELARVTFRVKAEGEPRLSLAGITARDGDNEPIVIAGAQPAVLPSHTSLTFAFPNPFAGSTEVQLSLRSTGAATLAVYDVAGRRVRTLLQGVQPAGSRMVSWDGRNDSGMRLAPGAYILRLETGGLVESRTVRLVR
jgi:hypothetical protein